MTQPCSWPDDGVILYDGRCGLCSRWIRFVARRDRDRRFRFTPIQSPYGATLAKALGIDPADPQTNAVLLDGRALMRSDGAIAIVSRLPGWRFVGLARFVPRPLRDAVYRLIARNRYAVFGTNRQCDYGGEALAGRVLTEKPD
ncbi:DUF393 domain-containing protein [Pararhizobium mangrovi]|uniref:DUF393 domain-containing protein n=2 Tax=Pararhizobium mangrovi TaxID=2590452 RepID=A0A506TY88_9HYPH|nr:DUF393 domain-containing protein [Pararhizobium mangrovi]